jgi:long-chain acyl-CoA synthetase
MAPVGIGKSREVISTKAKAAKMKTTIGEGDSIAGVFQRRVAQTPGAIAYRDFDGNGRVWVDYTWTQVAGEVARVRAALAAEGLAAGERIAIMLRNGLEWVCLDQAALSLGLVVVPVYVEDRPENIAYIVEDSGARLLFVEGDEHLKRLAEVRGRMPRLQRIVSVKPCVAASDARLADLDSWCRERADVAGVDTDGNSLATIVYTSGTSGKPKGVMLSHQNILQDVKSGLGAYDVFPSDVFLSFLPLSHMLERTVGYYLTMVAGSTVAFARSIALLSEDFRTVRPTVIVSVPRIYEKLHAAMRKSLEDSSPTKRWLFETTHRIGWSVFEWRQGRGPWLPSFLAWPLLKTFVASKLLERMGGRLRLCISGGAALSPPIAHTFIGLGLPICQGYGLTEASPVVSVNRLDRNDPASIGQPLPGVEVGFGENSALKVRGPMVMMGYWNNAEATAKVKSADGWLDTGDQARMENGFLYITGRLKEIIVLGNGEKVPPVDMELAIQLDPLFEQVMVVGEGKPYLSALVVLDAAQAKKAGEIGEKALAARIAAQIKGFPGYAQIREVAVIDEKWTIDNNLLTATLKPRRNEILARYKERIDELYRGR